MRLLDSAGTVLQAFEYDAYGARYAYDGSGASIAMSAIDGAGVYGYQGRRLDAETGFYYFRNRYLNVGLGRFLTMDPIGRWGDQGIYGNPYCGFGGSPYRYVDYSGLFCQPGEKPYLSFGDGGLGRWKYDPKRKLIYFETVKWSLEEGHYRFYHVKNYHFPNVWWQLPCPKEWKRYEKKKKEAIQKILSCIRAVQLRTLYSAIFAVGRIVAGTVAAGVSAAGEIETFGATTLGVAAGVREIGEGYTALFETVVKAELERKNCDKKYPLPRRPKCKKK